jgi:hypothetical protein
MMTVDEIKPVYDAFISYSHSDCGDIAPAIQKGIQTIGRPWYKLSRNLNVFRDELNLKASPHLWSSIEDALKTSDYFILFASPVAASSGWVSDEINVWNGMNYKEVEGLKKIFLVLTEGEIEWDKEKDDFDWTLTTALPKAALTKRFKQVPEWIDLRPYVKQNEHGREVDINAAGFTTAMTKIIGGIENREPWQVESDELRSQKNARTVRTIVGLALLCLTVAVFFLYKDAVDQRKFAVAQKDTAILNLKKFKIEEFNRNIRNGKVYLDAQEYGFAKSAFLGADSTLENKDFDTIPKIAGRKVEVASALKECDEKLTGKNSGK